MRDIVVFFVTRESGLARWEKEERERRALTMEAGRTESEDERDSSAAKASPS